MQSSHHHISDLMAPIAAGEIDMRDDRVQKRWTLEIPPFEIAKYPVTQTLFEQVMGKNPSTYVGPQNPVDSVSWMDAVRFCNRLSRDAGLSAFYEIHETEFSAEHVARSDGYRLPTEAEWEYACRAGTQHTRYGELDEIAWFQANSDGHSRPVGQKLPNAWGLFDTLGNVWEWCDDLYHREDYGAYRIFRGGGWADQERGCLATNRRRGHPSFTIDDLGFRIVRSLSV